MDRIRELDGIRGIAIFLVLLWHYIACQLSLDKGSVAAFFIRFLAITWSGVDLFFVLSGFLIVGILMDAKDSQSYFKTFYIRRGCRILPLYLIILCAFLILSRVMPIDWLFAEPLPLVSYFTFTQNFFMHSSGFGPHWLGVTWSLAIEEQFYLLIPLIAWKLNKKQLFSFFVTLICLAPLFRLILGNLGAYVFPFARADSILLGGLLAIIFRTYRIKAYLNEKYQILIVIFGILFFGATVLSFTLPDPGNVFSHLWLGMLYSLLISILLLRTDNPLNLVVSNRFFVWLGLRSYGIYLFHQPVSGIAHFYINGQETPQFSNISEFYATIISLIVVFLLSELSFRYFESFFLRYGKNFKYF